MRLDHWNRVPLRSFAASEGGRKGVSKKSKSKGGGGAGGGSKLAPGPAGRGAEQDSLLSRPPWRGFKFAGSVRPAAQAPKREVPPHIQPPDYADDGVPKKKGPRLPWQIEVSPASFERTGKVRG